MSTTEPSKYAENQFLSATDRSFSLTSEIVADTLSRAPIAAVNWTAGEITSINAEAVLPTKPV